MGIITSNNTRNSIHNHFDDFDVVVKYEKLSSSKEYFDVPGPVPKDIEVVVSMEELWKLQYSKLQF